jgi:hypothetical protein
VRNENNITVDERFYAPLKDAFQACSTSRNCPEYSDIDHAFSGIGRVIHLVDSGRDWIQQAAFELGMNISVSKFFDALKSTRRTQTLSFVADFLAEAVKDSASASSDPLAGYEELNGFAVYASDGHTIAASAHENEIMGKVRSHTHIYSLDLRHHSMSHLELCSPDIGKKKEHEIKTLQRIPAQAMRMGEPKGTKVIHCYDPAIFDFKLWANWKQAKGVYIITLEKSNSALQLVSAREWDASDSRNNGVLSDETMISSNKCKIRRVSYRDPVTGKGYIFLTTEMTLPPGIIAFLYKLRWDVEKFFDQSKNKFGEKKGWGKTENSKKQQAFFIAMAHNLCMIFERLIEKEEGIVDRKSMEKRSVRRTDEKRLAKLNGNPFNALVENCNRITQRSFQFIRWLRSSLRFPTPWRPAIDYLRPLMLKYIS